MDNEPITTSSEKKKEFLTNSQDSKSTGDGQYSISSTTSLEVKVAQLEITLSALKERVESERNLKLWIIGTVLAIVAGIFGAFTIYLNIIKDSQDSYRNLQNDYRDFQSEYFQKIIDIKNENSKDSIILNCLKSKGYFSANCFD